MIHDAPFALYVYVPNACDGLDDKYAKVLNWSERDHTLYVLLADGQKCWISEKDVEKA